MNADQKSSPGGFKWNRLGLSLAILAAVVGAALLWTRYTRPAEPADAPTPVATRQPFDFTVKDLQGAKVSLSDLRGKVVLVNLWATWCSPCKEELPVLAAFYHERKAEGFELVTVNVSEDAETAEAYLKENGFDIPAWSDPTGDVLLQIEAYGLPVSVLVDRHGGIIGRWMGPLTAEQVDEWVTPILAEK